MDRIFCIQCRSLLNIREVNKEAGNNPKSKPGPGRRRVWLLICAGIVVCAALALWPAPLENRKGTEADARQARTKILLLEKGLSPASQVFNEREINAYLVSLLRDVKRPDRPGVWTTVLQAAEAALHPNAIMLSTESVWGPVMAGSLQLGPWRLTSRITVVPERGPDGFQWTIRSGLIGHLPLPGPISAPATAALRPLLGASFRERALLMKVSHLELDEGQVTIAVKNRARAGP